MNTEDVVAVLTMFLTSFARGVCHSMEPRQYRRGEVFPPGSIDWNDWEKSFPLKHGWNMEFALTISFALLFPKGRFHISEIFDNRAKAKKTFLQFEEGKLVSLFDLLNNPDLWPMDTAMVTQENHDGNPAHGVLRNEEGFC